MTNPKPPDAEREADGADRRAAARSRWLSRASPAFRASVRRLSSAESATAEQAAAGASSASRQPTWWAIVGIVTPETKPPIVTPTCLMLMSRLRCRVVGAPRTITFVGGVISP